VKPVVFHPAARAEVDEAMAFYEGRATVLGLDFRSTVEDAVSKIQLSPQTWPSHKDTGFRKFVMNRFPFNVFYLEKADSIWIAAVAHHKRRPDYWAGRKPV
jgi:toxin ParE1/3/4